MTPKIVYDRRCFFLLTASDGLVQNFVHRVTGDGIDRDFVYRYRWLDITPDLHNVLVQGCNAFVSELAAVLKRGGSDAT